MIPSFTTLMSTIAGKVALGLGVAALSVGAAAAASAELSSEPAPAEEEPGVPAEESEPPAGEVDGEEPEGPALELPAPEEPSAEGSEMTEDGATDEDAPESADNHGDLVSSFAQSTTLEGCEKGQAVSAVARGVLEPSEIEDEATWTAYLAEIGKCQDDDEEAEEAVEEEAGEEEDADFTHGDVVSTFVHETDLEGCWKGQATAAVARGDIEPDEDGKIDPDEVDRYLGELDKCGGDYESGEPEEPASEEMESDEVETDDVEPKDDRKPDRPGKPDHAGQRGAEKSQGKAKGHDK